MNEWQSFKFKFFVVDSFRNFVRDVTGKSGLWGSLETVIFIHPLL